MATPQVASGDVLRDRGYTIPMRRNGPWAFVLLLVLAVALTYFLGPRPVYELWEARKEASVPLEGLSEAPRGTALLRDAASANGIEVGELPGLRPGDRLCDLDSDGDLDLVRADLPSGPPPVPGTETELRPRLYLNVDGRFRDVTSLMGPAFESWRPVVRARQGPDLDVADLDGDHKPDVILRSGDGSAWVLANRLAKRHALTIRLLAGDGSESRGVGRVELVAGGKLQVRLFEAPTSGTARVTCLHFGLGDHARAERLRVEWPSGIVVERSGLEGDQTIEVAESEGAGHQSEEEPWSLKSRG